MSTIYYKTSQNYFDPKNVDTIHVPQPFLNYGGLTKMLSDDYKYIPKDSSNITYSQPRPEPQYNNRRAMSARQRYEQNQILQAENKEKWMKNILLIKQIQILLKKLKIVFG